MTISAVDGIDAAGVRGAGKDLLSVALMDARNHTLYLSGLLSPVLESAARTGAWADHESPGWLLGHIGWFQERWIARNAQRHQGRYCDPASVRLPSVHPQADSLWDSQLSTQGQRWALPLPDGEEVKAYLLSTLETTLELLEKTPDQHEALYFHRLALFHEDRCSEALICTAQAMGVPLKLNLPGPAAFRAPMVLSGRRWSLGSAAEGEFAFANECPPQTLQVPEFEIDAQVVTWAQYVEFVNDGGYDQPECWHPQGWQWLAAKAAREGRRAPGYVEQMGGASGAVIQTRFGSPCRMLGNQPVMHVSWWEADAFARWAGRRLPGEAEWEMAACLATRQGWRWGDVWEWTGSVYRAYPGYQAFAGSDSGEALFGQARVLRGASFATRKRMKHPRQRCFALPGQDDFFVGFRTCAV
jgi:ergothioneine biosynthesis protein EgtB